MLPSELDIHRKQGFSIPMDKWLRGSEGRLLDDIQAQLLPWINKEELDRLKVGHLAGRANGSRLFGLKMLSAFTKNML